MSTIPLNRISRVIIGGEWFSVELGTFEVTEMAFADAEGNVTHERLHMTAYRFLTPNHDEYWGPLEAIELIKLLDI